MIVDTHNHCFPDSLAPRAVEGLTVAYGLTATFDGTVEGLRARNRAVGIDLAVVQPVATKASQVVSINDWAASIRSDSVISFGAMHPDFPGPTAELRRMRELGLKGVKFQPSWQKFRPDDERMLPIYEAMQGELIAYFHGGAEIDPGMKMFGTPESLARVHEMFPHLTMVVAHMGGFLVWEQAREFLIGSDVFLDTAYCLPEHISDDGLISLIRDHGADRVLFGSDAPCGDASAQLARIRALPLEPWEISGITGGNAARLLGLG